MESEDRIIANLLEQIDALKADNARLERGAAGKVKVTMLDYGAGNVRSVRNAIQKVSCATYIAVRCVTKDSALTLFGFGSLRWGSRWWKSQIRPISFRRRFSSSQGLGRSAVL